MAKKVLIIDDDPEYVEASATLLEAKGYKVVSALGGEEGFTKAKSESPDIILLDVMMTYKSEGFDIARNLKDEKKTKDIPVIMITGIRKEMNLPFGFETDNEWLPVKAVLEKPIKPDILLKTLEDCLKYEIMGTCHLGTCRLGTLLLALCIASPVFALGLNEKPKDIILIGWDGAQLDHVKECLGRGELPNLKKLSSEGSFVEIDIQGHQTETEPGFAQVLTGYDDEVSCVRGNDKFACIPSGYTIFERLEKHFGNDNFVTVALVNKGHRLNSNSPDKPYYNAGKASDVFRNGLNEDAIVAAEAIKLLEQYRGKPFFFFIQFAGPDKKGHEFGENSKEYNDALISCDKFTGDIVKKLKDLNLYDKAIIYVTADHGFDEGQRGHGFAPYIFMATNDPCGINRGFQADVTPTILDRFGIDVKKIEPPLYGKPLSK